MVRTQSGTAADGHPRRRRTVFSFEITEPDLASGWINHAIATEVLGDDCDWSSRETHGGLYPAGRTDCVASLPWANLEAIKTFALSNLAKTATTATDRTLSLTVRPIWQDSK